MRTRVYYAERCPTCSRGPAAPTREYDACGRVVTGCVDHFHTGHLVQPSESAWWHARTSARKIRAVDRERRGAVTEFQSRPR